MIINHMRIYEKPSLKNDDIASPSHEPDDPPAPPYSSGSEPVYLF